MGNPGDNVGLNIKGLDKQNMPRSGDVMVYKKDTTLGQTKEFSAQIQVLDIPNEIKVGYSPIGFVRCGRAACRISGLKWKMGKVDFLLLSVLTEETTENSHAVHPDHLLRHTGVCRTVTFTETLMTALSLRLQVGSCTGTRVHNLWFFNDKSIFDQFPDVLSRVGIGNF